MSYLKKSLWGLSWTAALRGSSRAVTILRTAILARILLPEQFGAFGIAAMAMALLEILTETGINVVLLQQKEGFEKYVDTAWIVSIARGLLISVLLWLFAPVIAQFFSAPDSLMLLKLVSIVPLLRGFINPSCVRFVKELRFDQEFLYRFCILAVEAGISIWAAVMTHSAASFVWGMIASSIAEVGISWIFIRPTPKIKFYWDQVKYIINQGKWVTGFGLFDYIFTQGDNIVVGRLLGTSALGLYRTSYSFSTLPVTEVSESYYKVMFPTFVEMAGQKRNVKSAVLKSVSVVSLTAIAIGLAVFIFAQSLVLLILGSNWIDAVPVVRVLAFVGMFRALAYVFNPFFVSQGKQKYVTSIIFTSMVGLLVTIVPLVSKYGVVGAGYSALIASVVSLPVTAILAWRTLRTV